MQARILIKVLNSTSDGAAPSTLTPETAASVAFVPEAMIRRDPERVTDRSGLEPYWEFDFQPETYKHSGEGHYVPDPDKAPDKSQPNPAIEPAPGQWLLVVQADKKTPVIQRVTVIQEGPRLRVRAGWRTATEDQGLSQAQATAETVHIFNYNKGDGPDLAAVNTLITVTLFPRSELVFMAGFDGGGTRFIRFAEVRRLDLHREGKTDNGTRSAFFDCAEGSRKLLVKAKSGWVVVASKTPDFVVGKDAPAAGPDRRMPMLELYRYLNQMGFEAPGSVLEVGVFSHAFVRGPILWNTFDRSESETERDPADLDGRAKDWQTSGAMRAFPDLQKGLKDDAIFKVWGCHFDPSLTAKFRAANERARRGTARSEFFLLTSDDATENLNADIIKHQIGLEFSGTPVKNQAYCAAAARHLNKPCFGTPPGVGANFINTRMVAVGTDTVYAYLAREFGISESDRDATLHMNYLPVANANGAKPGWSTEHWLMAKMGFHAVSLGPQKLSGVRLPSKCVLMRLPSAPAPAGLPFRVEARQGLVDPSQSGHLYFAERTRPDVIRDLPAFRLLFIQGDPDRDCGVYVQADRKFFIMRRARPSRDWEVDVEPVTVLKQARTGDAWMDDPGAAPTIISDGVLFVDTAEIHW